MPAQNARPPTSSITLMSTRRLDAAEAPATGLVSSVVPRGALAEAVAQAVAELRKLSPPAVAALKESLRRSIALPLEEAFEMDQKLRRPLDGDPAHHAALHAALAG